MKDKIPSEAEVEADVCHLRSHMSGRHTHLCVDHFKQWQRYAYPREQLKTPAEGVMAVPVRHSTAHHRCELLGNYPVFNVVMVIYHYVEIIWRILVTPNFLYNIYNHE